MHVTRAEGVWPRAVLARIGTLLTTTALPLACGETPTAIAPSDAAPDVSTPVVVDGGPVPIEPVTCGDATCPPPGESPLFAEACCLPDGSCGITAGLVSGACRRPGSPGSLDTTCAERRLPGGARLPGCCTESGACGSWDPESSLGCFRPEPGGGVPLEADAAECRFDPSADCTALAGLPCDGAEDCGEAMQCCGRIQAGRVDRVECVDSCASPSDRRAGVWLELCHVGDGCSEPGLMCRSDPNLPFLGRCQAGALAVPDAAVLDAGLPDAAAPDAAVPDAGRAGVRCGDTVCGTGETCCIREPRDPYCTQASAPCTCSGSP